MIAQVAQELDLPETEVALAVDSQFEMVVRTMKEGKHRPARLPYFGQWKVRPLRLKHFLKRAQAAGKA